MGPRSPGGQTDFQLFLDNLLTWNNAPTPDPGFGRQYGPGVVQNEFLNTPNVIIQVAYQFNDSNDPTGAKATFTDRVETYTAKLQPNNQWYIYDTSRPRHGLALSNAASLVNQPFQPMVNGRVKITLWAGSNSHRGRLSRISTSRSTPSRPWPGRRCSPSRTTSPMARQRARP